MIMGLPGAGKTTLAETYVTRGYLRLNRDEAGGSLNALVPALEAGARGRPHAASYSTTPMCPASRGRR